MEKVVPLFKTFKTIFYFKILEVGKILFGAKASLNLFKIDSNSFEIFESV
jgi:hypothetical protein